MNQLPFQISTKGDNITKREETEISPEEEQQREKDTLRESILTRRRKALEKGLSKKSQSKIIREPIRPARAGAGGSDNERITEINEDEDENEDEGENENENEDEDENENEDENEDENENEDEDEDENENENENEDEDENENENENEDEDEDENEDENEENKYNVFGDEPPVILDSYLTPIRRGFPDFIYDSFSKYLTEIPDPDAEFDENACQKRKSGKDGDFTPFRHQQLVRDYLMNPTPYRGLLFHHGLGSGKTCSSIGVAEALKDTRKVVIMLPASLKGNFYKQLQVCGDPYFRLKYKWKFLEKTIEDAAEIADDTGFDDTTVEYIIEKNDGFFVVDEEEGEKPFDMDAELLQKLNLQIAMLIREKYSFIHYNGFTEKSVNKLMRHPETKKKYNYFDNKIVIIDEIHNFISMYINKSKLAVPIYEKILKARNCKVVALTGTPIINSPNELAAIINLVHGEVKIREIELKSQANTDKIREALESSKYVHYFNIKPTKKKLEIVTLQDGFENIFTEDGVFVGVRKIESNVNMTESDRLKDIITPFKDDIQSVSQYSTSRTILPDDFDKFASYFIDLKNGIVKNRNLFMRRLLGKVSNYKGDVAELLPTFTSLKTIKMNMSEEMLAHYEKQRVKERKKEKKQKGGKGGGLFEKKPSLFKVFSRQTCNAILPDGLERPYKDDIEDDENRLMEYTEQKQRVLRKLRERKVEYYENLSRYSPKYREIIKRVDKSPGPALVYSQFISMEGLEMLGIALEGKGYKRLQLRKRDGRVNIIKPNTPEELEEYERSPKYVMYTGEEETEIKEYILDIFNSTFNNLPQSIRNDIPDGVDNLHGDVCKVLMISSSGAEGLDLKNIRQIHLMEPYWNTVRTKQVIGRGIRVCSHMDLPVEERHVELYQYIMQLTQEQIERYYNIQSNDKGKTTDQHILEIAGRKERIIEQFLNLMKRASVDCKLNATNEPTSKCCYKNFKNNDPQNKTPHLDIVMTPFIEDERKESDFANANISNKKPRMLRLKNGKMVAIFGCMNEVFDGDLYPKQLKVIGTWTYETGKLGIKLYN
jgi:hypothetical protein